MCWQKKILKQETEGGPLITDDGFVVGINFVDNYGFGNPLPTPVILASLDLWKSYRYDL